MAREDEEMRRDRKALGLRDVDEAGESMVPETTEEMDLKAIEDARRRSQRR